MSRGQSLPSVRFTLKLHRTFTSASAHGYALLCVEYVLFMPLLETVAAQSSISNASDVEVLHGRGDLL